jgi:hypothetical protein
LYIRVEPSLPDPLQIPYLTVQSENYNQKCFQASSAFSSVCLIPAAELKPGRIFTLNISCSIDTYLTLSTYLSGSLTVLLGNEVTLTAEEEAGLTSVIKVPISAEEKYNILVVTAFIANLEENIRFAKKGVTMLVNYGNSEVKDPSEEEFMLESEELFSGGRVAFLSNVTVLPGNWIKVYLKIRKGMTVVFSITEHDG